MSGSVQHLKMQFPKYVSDNTTEVVAYVRDLSYACLSLLHTKMSPASTLGPHTQRRHGSHLHAHLQARRPAAYLLQQHLLSQLDRPVPPAQWVQWVVQGEPPAGGTGKAKCSGHSRSSQ